MGPLIVLIFWVVLAPFLWLALTIVLKTLGYAAALRNLILSAMGAGGSALFYLLLIRAMGYRHLESGYDVLLFLVGLLFSPLLGAVVALRLFGKRAPLL